MNSKCSSPTVSDLPDISMHIFHSPTIISCSLIPLRVSCKVLRYFLSFLVSPFCPRRLRLLGVHLFPLNFIVLIVSCPTCGLLNFLIEIRPRANLKFRRPCETLIAEVPLFCCWISCAHIFSCLGFPPFWSPNCIPLLFTRPCVSRPPHVSLN